MIEAVIFDYGGTLVGFSFPHARLAAAMDRARPWIEAATGRPAPAGEDLVDRVLLPIEKALGEYEGGLEEPDYLDFYARGWARAGYDLPRDLLWRILDEEQRCWDEAAAVVPEAPGVLTRLRRRGLRLGIASNAPFPPPMMHRQLEGNGLAALVDAVLFSSEVGRRKPAPDLYLAACAALGVDPPAALYAGDKLREDYEGPIAAGLQAVVVAAVAPAGVRAVRTLAELEELV